MMKEVYISKKTGETFEIVSKDENGAVLALNGEEKAVTMSTLKRWYKLSTVEVEEEVVETADEVATESETQETEVTTKKLSKVENVITMIEYVLNNAGATYKIEDKTLYVNDKAVLKVLKTGVSIKEKDAKALGIAYERKGYNHAFKARVDVADNEQMEELLHALLEKEFDVVMYEQPLHGASVTGNEVEIIGECKLQLLDGKVIEQYLYNIVGYTPSNSKPFASHKGNIMLF